MLYPDILLYFMIFYEFKNVLDSEPTQKFRQQSRQNEHIYRAITIEWFHILNISNEMVLLWRQIDDHI